MKSIRNAEVSTAGFNADGNLYTSAELVPVARALAGNKIVLGFSGKDSLAMWLYLRERGFEIVPYMLYTVPGLQIDLTMREYYQDFFGQKIYYLPHPLFYEMLNAYQWQPAHRAAMMVNFDLPWFDFALVEDELAKENGLGDNYLAAVGYLATDNLGRNSFINRSGTLGHKHRKYYFAIWDWTFKDVMAKIRQHGVKLPRHYRIWGNTGTGRPFEYLGLKALREQAPDDYRRVIKWFPLLDLEFFRYEVVSKWQTESKLSAASA